MVVLHEYVWLSTWVLYRKYLSKHFERHHIKTGTHFVRCRHPEATPTAEGYGKEFGQSHIHRLRSPSGDESPDYKTVPDESG